LLTGLALFSFHPQGILRVHAACSVRILCIFGIWEQTFAVCAAAKAGRTHIIERSVRLCNLILLYYLKALVRVDTFVLFRYESRTAANNFSLALIGREKTINLQ